MSVSQTRHNIAYVMGICCVAALGGLLLGYDSSVISGAIEPLSHHYQLSPAETGWAVSNVIIGCVVGCLIAGQIADRYGRKKTLLVTALLFVASVAGTALAPEFGIFVLFRMIGGLGIGMASVVSPVYIAEVAPKDYRGRAMTMHMICCVGGGAGVADQLFDCQRRNARMAQRCRMALDAGICLCPMPAVFLFISFIPESPRWNVMAGHDDRALKTLTRISSAAHAENVLREIKTSLRSETHATHANERLRFNKRTLIFLVIGVGLTLFNQLTGINVIQYFGPSLLRNVTGSMEEAMFMTIWLAVMQFVGVIVGMALIDRVGRTRLLSVGSWGAALCLILTFISFYSGMKGVASVIGLFGFMFILARHGRRLSGPLSAKFFPPDCGRRGWDFQSARCGPLIFWSARVSR